MKCPDCETEIDTMERCRCEDPHQHGTSASPSGSTLIDDMATILRIIANFRPSMGTVADMQRMARDMVKRYDNEC